MHIKDVEAIYPPTPLQEALLLNEAERRQNGLGQIRCQLHGALDAAAFEEACRRVVSRRPLLRASFVWNRLDSPLQLIHKSIKLSVMQRDLRDLSADAQEAELQIFAASERASGFDPVRAPLFRLALFRAAEDAHEFVCSYSRLLLDGFSSALMLQDILASYDAVRTGGNFNSDEPCYCRDYIAWLKSNRTTEEESFWREMLEGLALQPRLVPDFHSVEGQNGQNTAAPCQRQISSASTGALAALAMESRIAPATLIVGAWAILLNRYIGTAEVAFGARLSSRPPEPQRWERVLGPFSNTLPIRVHVPAQGRVLDWLSDLDIRLARLRQFAHNSPDQIRRWVGVSGNESISETAVVLDNVPVDQMLRGCSESLDVRDLRCIEQPTSPLTLNALYGRRLTLELAYDCNCFEAGVIERMLGHLEAVLEKIADCPGESLSRIEVLTDAELLQVLVEWNNTAFEFPKGESVCGLFAAQVERAPDATVLAFEQEQLSYFELNRRANQLAHYLRKLGVGPEVKVGVCAERSPEMIVGVLGILKAGGAFVPLDPAYPLARLAFMLEEVQSPVLLVQERLLGGLPATWGQVICLDTDWNVIEGENDQDPVSGLTPANLAYVIFTSGSTGEPKGVLVSHAGLCNVIRAQRRTFEVQSNDRVIQFASFSFDASIFEIFMALGAGGTLYLARPDSLLIGPALLDLLRCESITNLTVPPSSLGTVPEGDLPALATIVVAGEACPSDLMSRWAPGRRFFNAYGPTESTIWASVAECDGSAGRPSIGRPIDNAELYVLNSRLQPLPAGMPGELHIGGLGLARGYLRRPDLTSERFIPNPFCKSGGGSLYKTGDLVRFLPDGNIDFLGRIDHQVKIRGFRIEPEEIEVVLRSHPSARDGAIGIHTAAPGDNRLFAYVVCDSEHPATSNDLLGFLKERLPEYMVPSGVVFLDALPLTFGGKLDRQALPDPIGARPELSEPYVPPRTQIEQTIASLWREALKVERVGLNDNFFDLGGHSLLMVQIHNELRKRSKRDLSLLDMFTWPTVGSLSKYLSQEDDLPPSQEADNLLEKLNEGKERLKRLLNQRSRTANR